MTQGYGFGAKSASLVLLLFGLFASALGLVGACANRNVPLIPIGGWGGEAGAGGGEGGEGGAD